AGDRRAVAADHGPALPQPRTRRGVGGQTVGDDPARVATQPVTRTKEIIMIRHLVLVPLFALALLALGLARADTKDEKPDDKGFVPIFDGKTLDGWHVSGKTGHGTGGKWVAEDGAIVGSQDKPGNGGILITDKEYGDFEVVLEMKNDFGPDSGLFLRSNQNGQAC